jgi:hypothetical protein
MNEAPAGQAARPDTPLVFRSNAMNGWKKIAGAAALTLACAQAWAVPTLTFSTPSSPAAVGSTVKVDVLIAGITDLAGYQFGVNFDNTLLHFDGVTTGNFLNGGDTTSFGSSDFNDTDGTIDYVFDARKQSGVNGDGVLATLSFDTLTAGSAALSFLNVGFIDPDFNEIVVAAIPGTLSIGATSAVPEPASLALFGIGGAAAFLRRRGARARA